MNSRRTITLATLITAAISFVGMAQAQTQTLNITEISSTSLTASLNEVPQTVAPIPGNNDHWFMSIPGLVGIGLWQEPGESTFNIVQGPQGILIASDQVVPGVQGLPNGATDKTDFTFNGSPLWVTFTDLGDTPSTVPDTTTTLELLGLSLATLGILAKVRPSTTSASV